MEQVPVVKKSSNTWFWVIAAIAIILLLLWAFGAFTTSTTTTGTTGDNRPIQGPAIQVEGALEQA